MKPDAESPVLFEIQPKQKLVLCGSGKKNMLSLAKQAVQDWADNSMRRNLQIETSPSCRDAKTAAASIELIFDDPEQCDGSIAGYHEQDGSNHLIVACPDIVDFSDKKSSKTQDENLLALLRHEVGHAFGLCDQYVPERIDTNRSTIGFNPENCNDKEFQSLKAKRSVMGSNYDGSPNNLTPDDVFGIRLGACRDDSKHNGDKSNSVNRLWLNLNPDELSSWLKDDGFQNEISGLVKRGVPILKECIAET